MTAVSSSYTPALRVDFSKRDELDDLLLRDALSREDFLEHHLTFRVNLRFLLEDDDLQVYGTIRRKNKDLYARLDWNTVKYKARRW